MHFCCVNCYICVLQGFLGYLHVNGVCVYIQSFCHVTTVSVLTIPMVREEKLPSDEYYCGFLSFEMCTINLTVTIAITVFSLRIRHCHAELYRLWTKVYCMKYTAIRQCISLQVSNTGNSMFIFLAVRFLAASKPSPSCWHPYVFVHMISLDCCLHFQHENSHFMFHQVTSQLKCSNVSSSHNFCQNLGNTRSDKLLEHAWYL